MIDFRTDYLLSELVASVLVTVPLTLLLALMMMAATAKIIDPTVGPARPPVSAQLPAIDNGR